MWEGKAGSSLFRQVCITFLFSISFEISNSSFPRSTNNFSEHAMCHFRMLSYTLTGGRTDQQELPLKHGGETW